MKKKDAETIELFRVALTNAELQPGIAKVLAENGYDSEVLNQGRQLLDETRQMFENSISKKDIRIGTHDSFTKSKRALGKVYDRDRKKARLVYRNDTGKTELLGISKPLSMTYIKWIETVKKFYSEALADQDMQADLARLNLTLDHINDAIVKITEVEAARAEHMKVKGEAQDSTKATEHSIAKMKDWMKEFFGVAKLGLIDQPQLLESLGKVVKG